MSTAIGYIIMGFDLSNIIYELPENVLDVIGNTGLIETRYNAHNDCAFIGEQLGWINEGCTEDFFALVEKINHKIVYELKSKVTDKIKDLISQLEFEEIGSMDMNEYEKEVFDDIMEKLKTKDPRVLIVWGSA